MKEGELWVNSLVVNKLLVWNYFLLYLTHVIGEAWNVVLVVLLTLAHEQEAVDELAHRGREVLHEPGHICHLLQDVFCPRNGLRSGLRDLKMECQ